MINILSMILSAYIIYNIFSTRGYKYALIFSYAWDIFYFTLSNRGLSLQVALIMMIIMAVECYIKISIDYYVYKKTNNFWIYLILSVMLEFSASVLLTWILSIIL